MAASKHVVRGLVRGGCHCPCIHRHIELPNNRVETMSRERTRIERTMGCDGLQLPITCSFKPFETVERYSVSMAPTVVRCGIFRCDFFPHEAARVPIKFQ